jgi:DNA-binding transcriptional MerR regulator
MTDRIMLTTNEVARAVDLSAVTLNEWATNGIITPAVKGKKGKGNSHCFTSQQAIGLAVVAALH